MDIVEDRDQQPVTAASLVTGPWPGAARPLRATDRDGNNFAVFSAVAEQVHVCLFDDVGTEERIPLTGVKADIWHAYVRWLSEHLILGEAKTA